MTYVQNVGGDDVKLVFGGKEYVLPASVIVEIDDENVAREFVRRTTKLERGEGIAQNESAQLAIVTSPAVKPAEQWSFLPKQEERLGARYQPPPATGKPSPVEPRLMEMEEKRRIALLDGGLLMEEGKRFKVWKRGVERATLVDALWAAGYRARN